MGGKNSKAAKPHKKGKKSKGQKDLEGVSAPDGKYDEQATLPRPDLNFDGSNDTLNLDGSNSNLANGARFDISTDSIPNADLDLETDYVKEVSQTATAKVNDAEKDVSTKVSREAEQVSQNVDTKAEEITSDVKRTSWGISNDITHAKGDVSNRISQEAERVSQNVDAKGEEITSDVKRTSQSISNDITDAKDGVSRRISQAEQGSQNFDAKASEISLDVERTSEEISSDITDGKENVSSRVSQEVDQFSQNVDVKASGISSEVKRTSEEISSDITDGKENVSSRVSQEVDQFSHNVDAKASGISSEVKRTSGEMSNDFRDANENFVVEGEKFSENVDRDIEDAGITAGVDASGHLLQNGRGFGDYSADAAEDLSEGFKTTGEEASEAVEADASNVTTFSENVSSSIAQDVNEFDEYVHTEVDDRSGEFRSSLSSGANDFSESVAFERDEAENEIDGLSAEMRNSAEVEVESEIKGLRNSAESSSVVASEMSEEVSVKAEDIAQNVDENVDRNSSAVQSSIVGGAKYANKVSRDISFKAESTNEEASEPRISVANLRKSFEGGVQENNTHNSFEPRAAKAKTTVENAIVPEVKAESFGSVSSSVTQELNQTIDDNETEIDRAQTTAIGAASVGQISVKGRNSFSSEDPDAPFVTAFDDFRNGSLQQFLSISAGFKNEVSEIALKVKRCFDSQRDFLSMASRSKEPSPADLPALLKPMSENISSVTEFAEQNRKSKQWNHLSAVSSGIGALGWVAVQPTPGPFVKDMMDSSLFYSNKVLKEFKGVDENQVNWCKSLTGIFNELITYIKQYHTTGVVWNPQGSAATASAPAPPAGGPPPPAPPPPPPGSFESSTVSSGGDDRSALFSSLNKGTDVTKGLKRVTDDMKTHKNPGLRQGPAPFKANKSPSPVTAPKPGKAAAPIKPPHTELEGDKKWIVEYHNGNPSIVIEKTSMKQVVYIYKCTQSSIQIKGKVNSVVVDSCKKVGVVVDDVVSSLEFVNCQSVQGQIMGKAPTISIDKTDGCMVYLSKDSLDTSIVTAKSSEMNVLVPQGDGDYTEFPVPEQFKTSWNGKAFVTEMADIA